VSIARDKVRVVRWDKGTWFDTFEVNGVFERLEEFYSVLESDQPGRENSIVAHVIRVFRGLRRTLPREFSGADSLEAFLVLLACAQGRVEPAHLDRDKWSLSDRSLHTAEAVPKNEWRGLIGALTELRYPDGLQANLDLLLRHVSGKLFQEAHYELISTGSYQLTLLPMVPSPARVRQRTTFGAIFTPSPLVRSLVEEALRYVDLTNRSLTIFDPACGSGEFLRESLRQLGLQAYRGRIRLLGWDISPAACAMAQFTLAWEVRDWTPNVVEMQIVNRDALDEGIALPRDVDVIVMNPPFVSWEDLNKDWRQRLTTLLGEMKHGRPDISMAFVWLANKSLSGRGVLATVLPASLLRSTTARSWRESLANALEPHLIARLGNQWLFPGVAVDAALYVASRGEGGGAAAAAVWADYRPTSSSAALRTVRRLRARDLALTEEEGEGFSVYADTTLGRTSESWEPSPLRQVRLLHRLSNLPRAGDLFYIRQGARTGLNRAFIVPRDLWESLPRSERKLFRPAVLNSTLRDGRLVRTSYIFFPYQTAATPPTTESHLSRIVPQYYNRVLRRHKSDLVSRTGANRWWLLTRHRAWQEQSSPKLVSTYFGKAGSYAWDESGDFVVVQGFAWLPKGSDLNQRFTTSVALAYLAILNSELMDDLLASISVHIGGGQWDLSPRYLNRLPLPDLASQDFEPDLLEGLARIGRAIHQGADIPEGKYRDLLVQTYRM
jgi:predicted RNA methylase